jgi:DNA processing protein
LASIHERAAVLALVAATTGEWHRTAVLVDEAGSALRLLRREWNGLEPFDVSRVEQLVQRVPEKELEQQEKLILQLGERGVQVTTILDDEYPVNLRTIYNPPPMLFVRGSLIAADDRAVAVVGTRQASPEGLLQATGLAQELAASQITVLSGLARGIDTAAHKATLRAGGRTIAVMGSGIDRIYPSENRALAEEIIEAGGALVSQFWPSAPPTRYSFPMRNVVMSGMSIGTAVIEASSTSGARGQARIALDHGKRVFLVEDLVTRQEWARVYAQRDGAMVVKSTRDIVDAVVAALHPPKQLSLA